MKEYLPILTVTRNRKGVLDIDTVKGCTSGMAKYPDGGCYGLCYAAKMAKAYGMDFTKSVSRKECNRASTERAVICHPSTWFRIGTMGDPCHDWDWTVEVCEWLGRYKTPIIVTKSWIDMEERHIRALIKQNAVINISVSPLDTPEERKHRLGQFLRLREASVRAVIRIVSARFGDTKSGQRLGKVQRYLFSFFPSIDNPLRIPMNDPRVLSGDIITERHIDLGGGSIISRDNEKTYIGKCEGCPDQCGLAYY